MATPKKKHLIELMIEAGVKWPNGAEYAAQDKGDKTLHFYSNGKPNIPPGTEFWMAHNCDHDMDETIQLELVCRNWHQTIVTREQYAEALSRVVAAPDVQHDTKESHGVVIRNYPDLISCSSIEQLTSEYHAKAAEADRLQAVADEALKAADDALIALENAGELIGLVISIGTMQKQPEQPVITDWRDLRVGDVIECYWFSDNEEEERQAELMSESCTVTTINPVRIEISSKAVIGGVNAWNLNGPTRCNWRFIRRT